MMRTILLAGAAMLAVPASAQDHAMHHAEPATEPEKGPGETAHEGMDHGEDGQMDHSQMDHSEGQTVDHSQMDHSQMDRPQGQAMDHSGHSMPDDKSALGAAPETAVPARAFEGPRHAADAIWGEASMAPARAQLARENGGMKTGMIMVERLEARIGENADGYLWDGQLWSGGDINRFVLKTEGEGEFSGDVEDAEIQALYSRAIGPFFDLQAGVRQELASGARTHAVIGIQGLAPYMFHVDAMLFVSTKGDVSARVEAEYDQKITQQLILQPRLEVEASAQDIADRGIGAGLTKIEPGLRLRYEIVPEFAPYVGVEYEAKLGATADLARADGEDPDGLKFLVGLRAWF